MTLRRAVLLAIPLAASIACSSGNLNGPDSGTATTGQGGAAGTNTGQAGNGGGAGTTGTAGADAGATDGAAPAGTTGQTGGTGGLGGIGGAGGAAGGTGGTGTGAPTPLPPPRCLRDLIATCPLAGDCQHSFLGGDGNHRWCFASGETVSARHPGAASEPGLGRFYEVRRSDGSLCYSIESICGPWCETGTYTWKNGAGEVVARAQFGSASLSVTCESTGETCTTENLPAAVARESCVTTAAKSPIADVTCSEGTCP